MIEKNGYKIARVAEIPWEDRVNVDGWPSRAGMYYDDTANSLCMRLIHYPVGSTEPRHVHPGMHATTVLEGRTVVDGLTLVPLDVIVGPSNEPHGPLHYPEGCRLFSAFQGSYYHKEVEQLSSEHEYRLVQSSAVPWIQNGDAQQTKTLVERGLGRLLLQLVRLPDRALIPRPTMLAALVFEGGIAIGNEALGPLDFFYATPGADHSAIECRKPTTLLTVTMR